MKRTVLSALCLSAATLFLPQPVQAQPARTDYDVRMDRYCASRGIAQQVACVLDRKVVNPPDRPGIYDQVLIDEPGNTVFYRQRDDSEPCYLHVRTRTVRAANQYEVPGNCGMYSP